MTGTTEDGVPVGGRGGDFLAGGDAPDEHEFDLPVPDDLVGDLFPLSRYEQPLEVYPLPPFRPWHRPRKQYVRTRQWVRMVRELLDQDARQEPLDYLGLPGSDLIDIEMFASECEKKSREIRYLGFDESAQGDSVGSIQHRLNVDVVIRGSAVHRSSQVLPDDIRDLADHRSRARDAVGDRTFDVVNLDLCGSRVPDPSGGDGIYRTLAEILDIQSARVRPWIILLTHRFDRDGASSQQRREVSDLANELQARISGCSEAVPSDVPIIDDGRLPALDACDDDVFCHVAAAALVSWLWSVAQENRPANVRWSSVMGYRLRAESVAVEMLSIGIWITPKARRVNDPSGVLPSRPNDGLQEDCQQLAQLLRRTSKVVDVDSLLRERQDTFEDCRQETANLLERRGYSRSGYFESGLSGHIGSPVEARD